MNAYLLSRRHSERNGLCDVHKSYVGKDRFVASIIVTLDDGERVQLRICRPCFEEGAKCAEGMKVRR